MITDDKKSILERVNFFVFFLFDLTPIWYEYDLFKRDIQADSSPCHECDVINTFFYSSDAVSIFKLDVFFEI